MLKTAMAALAEVQQTLNKMHRDEAEEYDRGPETFEFPDYLSRLFVSDLGGRLAVEYYGVNYETKWELVQTALASKDVAPHLALLRLSGPDERATASAIGISVGSLSLSQNFQRLGNFISGRQRPPTTTRQWCPMTNCQPCWRSCRPCVVSRCRKRLSPPHSTCHLQI